MEPAFDIFGHFCRINVHAAASFRDFVVLISRCAGGPGRANTVRSPALDISVFENDDYDTEKSQTGEDRWLHFRYTLEIDPREGVSTRDYVAAIGALLESLWSSGLDAVAACDFEEQLPRNVRRLMWAGASGTERDSGNRAAISEGADIVVPASGLIVPVPIADRRTPQRQAEDERIASEAQIAPLPLPPDTVPLPVETHLPNSGK